MSLTWTYYIKKTQKKNEQKKINNQWIKGNITTYNKKRHLNTHNKRLQQHNLT